MVPYLYLPTGKFRRPLNNAKFAVNCLLGKYSPDALAVDHTDAINLEFANWRFNLRSSNTEPVVCLNVESKKNAVLMLEKTAALLTLLRSE